MIAHSGLKPTHLNYCTNHSLTIHREPNIESRTYFTETSAIFYQDSANIYRDLGKSLTEIQQTIIEISADGLDSRLTIYWYQFPNLSVLLNHMVKSGLR